MAKNGVYKGRPCSADTVKKKVDFQGIQVCIDRPKGFVMKGTDEKGQPWERTYKYDYGFIPKTLGGDDDGLDVFIGPDKSADHAYWAVQKKPDGSFDEYKCMLGYPSREAATAAYIEHIPRKLLDGLVTIKVDMMKAMLGIAPMGKAKTAMAIVSCLDELEKIAEEGGLDGVKKKLVEVAGFAKEHPPRQVTQQVARQFVDQVKQESKPILDRIRG